MIPEKKSGGYARMLVILLLTAFCAAVVIFYGCFVVALCNECKPRVGGHWVLLRIHRQQVPVFQFPARDDQEKHAA